MLSPIVALVLSYLAGWPAYLALVHYGVIDRPNERSSHSRPTARGGGVAILFGVLVVGLDELRAGPSPILLVLLIAFAGLAAVSFLDDLRSLPVWVRIGCHGLAALSILSALEWPRLQVGLAADTSVGIPFVAGLILAFLWIVGYTNGFNFMDGINGIAAGQAAVTGLGMALLGGLAVGDFKSTPVRLSLAVAGAAVGFLPHNFPKARMFMGDVGSAPLGFILAALALWLAKDAGWWLVVPLLLLHANFILDTGFTLLRRLIRGERWYTAHREHFYQRLVRAGKSHTFVTVAEMGLQLAVLGLMLGYIRASLISRLLLIVAVATMWFVFFAWSEVCFRRSSVEKRR